MLYAWLGWGCDQWPSHASRVDSRARAWPSINRHTARTSCFAIVRMRVRRHRHNMQSADSCENRSFSGAQLSIDHRTHNTTFQQCRLSNDTLLKPCTPARHWPLQLLN